MAGPESAGWRRCAPPGIGPASQRVSVVFEGREIEAQAGESLAAALLAAGEITFRITRGEAGRAPYCGMGACFDCLVEIDGESRRACLEPVRQGLAVRRHRPRGLSPPPAGMPAPLPARAVDVAVVGAGPAGLAAAAVLARAGLACLVIDERKQPGGQYYKQPHAGLVIDEARLDGQFRAGRALIAEARAAGAELFAGASVTAADATGLLIRTPEGLGRVAARRIIVATGAAERNPPFPGWTLPGVVTTGAAQSLLRSEGLAPSGRIVIAGNGPLNLQLAAELARAGADVAVLVEAAAPSLATSIASIAAMSAAAPGLVRDGLFYRLRAARAGISVRNGWTILAAEGRERLEAAIIAPLGADRRPDHTRGERIACDALCLGYGFAPSVELARALGCRLSYDQRWRHLAVARDPDARTTRPEVFAIGDGATFGGARAALAEGRLAGAAILRDLGAAPAAADLSALPGRRSGLARARRFQAALWRLYAAPLRLETLATRDTLVCRCEEVSLARLDAAIAGGAATLGAIKRETRLAMGRCGGRYCAPFAAERLAAATGLAPGPDDAFAPRPPLRPVSIAELASLGDPPRFGENR